jgi:hypothetical protein
VGGFAGELSRGVDPTLFLLRQLAEYLAHLPPQFSIPLLAPALGDKHHMVFALPLGMA